jgi:hypothetical protein
LSAAHETVERFGHGNDDESRGKTEASGTGKDAGKGERSALHRAPLPTIEQQPSVMSVA